MNDAASKYMTRNVPRYTSYPTAPHFSDRVGAEEYATALSALDPSDPVSLYLHVPFCRQLCWYCACNMKLASREAPIARYARTLMREIDLLAEHLPGRMTVSHLHWGGGTPTALLPDDLEHAMDKVAEHFLLDASAELAIESDPRTLTPQMTRRIGKLGFTRASFGVQEFDARVQEAINRVQPPDMVRRAVGGLRDVGVTGINFDLIYGLPHQTVETLLSTVDLCVGMKVDRIALFGYAHVPWVAKRQRLIDEATLPGPAERLWQARAAAQALTEAGYVALGLDHFARPEDPLAQAAAAGRMRRNFQGYTTDQAETLLGVGATSIGRTPSSHFQNIAETGAWSRAVEAGVLPVGKGCPLSADDRLRGRVIERLMCRGWVDLVETGAAFGASGDWFADALSPIADFAEDGLVTLEDGILRVTEQGAPLVRVIASAFDEYLATSPARHAIAV